MRAYDSYADTQVLQAFYFINEAKVFIGFATSKVGSQHACFLRWDQTHGYELFVVLSILMLPLSQQENTILFYALVLLNERCITGTALCS